MGLIGSTCVNCGDGFTWFTGGPRLCGKCYVPQPGVGGTFTDKFLKESLGSTQVITGTGTGGPSVLKAIGWQELDKSNPLLKDPGYAVAYLVDKIRKHGFADPITQKALFEVYEVHRSAELP